MHPTSPDRSIHGTWTAARLLVTHDGARTRVEPWVLDVVLDEHEQLRALSRFRPSRGTTGTVARLIEKAISRPLTGRPHLPALLRVPTRELAREVREMPTALVTEIGPTPGAQRVLEALARTFVPAEVPWRWLEGGVGSDVIGRLQEGIERLAASFAWYTLTGQEAVRAVFAERGQTLHLRLAARNRLDGALRLALHVARDEATLAAWREGLVGDAELVIEELDLDELSTEAMCEREALGLEGAEVFARVTVGPGRRAPSAEEVEVAVRAVEAFTALYDTLEGGDEGQQERELTGGEVVLLEVHEPEYVLFPENDGGLELEEDSPAQLQA